jgi:hypothetical protein
MEGEEAYEDLTRLREVVKLEQFCDRLPPDLRIWLTDKSPKTLVEAAKLADEYTALRKATQYSMPSMPFQRDRGYNYNSGNNYKVNVGNTQKMWLMLQIKMLRL